MILRKLKSIATSFLNLVGVQDSGIRFICSKNVWNNCPTHPDHFFNHNRFPRYLSKQTAEEHADTLNTLSARLSGTKEELKEVERQREELMPTAEAEALKLDEADKILGVATQEVLISILQTHCDRVLVIVSSDCVVLKCCSYLLTCSSSHFLSHSKKNTPNP